MQPPWTEIGRLESDVREIKNQINQLAQSHEVHQINSNVDSLECTLQELICTVDIFRYEFESIKEKVEKLEEKDNG